MTRTFMREKGHTCADCNSRHAIEEAQDRIAGTNNAMLLADSAPTAEGFQTPLDLIVKSVFDLFGWNKPFR